MPEEQGTSRRRADPERRQARGKLACLRCQRRKIRCDGDLPACKNCRNVGAACTDGLSARLKDLPRAEISSLKARIAWLESIIRQRCPDIDLENGQPPQDIDPAMLEVSTLEPDTGITTNIQDLPQEIEDSMLTGATRHASSSAKSLGISYSVHLFRATKINSEIKYVANSIVQEAPRYAYPPQTDIHGWQNNVLRQLDEWLADIPSGSQDSNQFMPLVCQLRYHGLCLLLLRPSPAIPKPTVAALVRCHKSATESIKILDQMYRKNFLIHNWISLHGLVLSVLTLLYCVKAEPEVARAMQTDVLTETISSALGILSATGEHWAAAKKCRDILEDLAKSTIQWLRSQSAPVSDQPVHGRSRSSRTQARRSSEEAHAGRESVDMLFLDTVEMDSMLMPFDGLFAESDSVNIDVMMQSLFQDFIPTTTTL
ncbi:hypothetical protein V2A60_007118 [Cordyceps javanica]